MQSLLPRKAGVGLAVAVAAAVTVRCVRRCRRLRLVRKLRESDGPGSRVQLLEEEHKHMLQFAGPVCTETVYSGKPPVDQIRSRVAEVVAANHWLAGRLRRNEAGEAELFVPADPAAQLERLVTVHPDAIPTSGADREAALRKYSIPIGSVDDDHPVFRVVLYTQEGGWTLVAMLSHVVADGYTFYEVYGMLNPSTPIRTLNTRRKMHWSKELPPFLGKEKHTWMRSGILIATVLFRIIFRTRSTPRGSKLMIRHVNLEWVEQQKAAHKKSAECPWVSTNDIVTSWFCRITQPTVALMAFNGRNRLEGFDDDDAGNYESVVPLCSEDFESPEAVRGVVQSKFQSRFRPLGLMSTMNMRMGILTNWATFYKDVEFPGCQQQVHQPVVDIGFILSPVAIIFKPTKDTLAMCVNIREKFVEGVAASPAIGPAV